MKHPFTYIPILLACYFSNSIAQNGANPVELTSRLSAQQDVASHDEIVDDTFIIVGSGLSKTKVTRQITDGAPEYHFSANGDANRIEFTTCFGSEENLKGISDEEIEVLKKIKSIYEYSDQGNYGETVTYEWKARFPEKMEAGKGGIFAQWHGRPDRTLLQDPKGNLKHWPKEEFAAMLDTMYFEKNIGFSNKSNQPNGWLVEQSAGGPIGAFHFREDYLYLIIRSDANRMSDHTIKTKPKPGKHLNILVGSDGKYGTIAFERSSDQIPINEWISFKVKIKYSKYDPNADKVITKGKVEVWMNDEKVTDWDGDVGKNDIHGPYFKFGIYKPGENGFKVDCREYKQTIDRKPTAIHSTPLNEIKAYPNPVIKGNSLHLATETKIDSLELYNINGQKVYSSSNVINNSLVVPHQLKAGLYIIKANSAKKSELTRIKVI